MPLKRTQTAFTLFELMLVVLIIGILAALAYPAVTHWFQSMESKRVERMFKETLNRARMESFVHKKDVLICTLNSQQQCDRLSDDKLWVFFDQNDNNQRDSHEPAIYEQDWQIRHGRIELRSSALRHYIRYMGDTSKPRGHFGHMRYCSDSDDKKLSFKVIFNMHGNIRVERGDLVEVGC